MSIDPVVLTQDLIRCKSVTPADDGAQDVLVKALAPLGFSFDYVPFENILNLFASLTGAEQGADGPHFCFCGHTDVVPAGDESSWLHPPFSGTVDDGKLYGRGASDMKGNIAAFVAAVSKFITKHGKPNGTISLLITGDEEAEAINGTVKVLEWMDKNDILPDHALVGEPSNPSAHGDEIKIGRRGSLSGHLTVKGKQGHVAYPDLADNPLPRMVKLLGALGQHAFDEGNARFQPTNLEITSVDAGNPSSNVIPASVTASFNVRFNDRWTADTILDEINNVLGVVSREYELKTWSNAESFVTESRDFLGVVKGAVQKISGRDPALTTNGGTSDARFVSRYCPVVEYGVCNATIYQVDEHMKVSDLEMLVDIYLDILEAYFSVSS